MKKILTLFVFTVIVCSFCFAQKDKAQIEGTIVTFFDGLSELSSNKLKEVTTPDFLLLEVGEVWNLDTLINKIAPMKNLSYERVNRFEFIKTEQTGNIAWVSYHNTAEIKVNNNLRTVKWLESAVLILESGKWKIKLLHSTQINTGQ